MGCSLGIPFVEHSSELIELFAGEFLILNEMGHHGRQRAAIHFFEKRNTGLFRAIGLADEGAIDIGAAFFGKTERPFLDQTIEQSLDGFGMPTAVLLGETLDNGAGWARSVIPDHFHDRPFGIGYSGESFHDYKCNAKEGLQQ